MPENFVKWKICRTFAFPAVGKRAPFAVPGTAAGSELTRARFPDIRSRAPGSVKKRSLREMNRNVVQEETFPYRSVYIMYAVFDTVK